MTRLQNRMTNYTDQPQQSATWETHVVIPVAQNAIGGAAAAILVGIGLRWFMFFPFDLAMDFALLAGFGSFSLISLLRFFGDDLGVFPAIFAAGKATAQKQIDALVAENDRLRAQLVATRRGGQLEQGQDDKQLAAYHHAKQLLEIAHTKGMPAIARAQVQTWCKQRPWERAMALMRAAGTLTDDDQLASQSLAGSYKLLNNYWGEHKQHGNNYVAKW